CAVLAVFFGIFLGSRLGVLEFGPGDDLIVYARNDLFDDFAFRFGDGRLLDRSRFLWRGGSGRRSVHRGLVRLFERWLGRFLALRRRSGSLGRERQRNKQRRDKS